MRIFTRAARRLALVGWVGLVGLTLAPAAGRAAAPMEKALPGSTLAYIKADSVAKFRAAFDASQMGRLLGDSAMKPFKDDILAKFEDASKEVKEKIGLSIGELLELPQGAASVAIVTRDDPKVPIAFLITADAGPNDAEMNDLMGRLTGLAEKDGAKVSTETFKGLKLTTLHSDKGGDEPPVTWTKQGTVYHIATDGSILKDVLTHADGREDSLASTEGYQAVVKKAGGAPQLLWYLDLAQVLKLATQAAAEGGNAEQIVAQMQLLGVNNLKAIGGGFTFGGDQYDSISHVYLYAPGPAQGVVRLFSMPQVDLKPQPWVPATVAAYQSISWDLDNFYTALNDLANQFAPGMFENIEKGLAGPEGEGISFQKDVFGPLGDRITLITDFKKPITEKSQRMLAAISLEDAREFQSTFNRILGLAQLSPKKREFQGTTIYDFDLSGLEELGAGDVEVEGPLSVAIAKNHLFLTSDSTLLEQVLRAGGASLADSPEYQAVAKLMPTKSSTLAYTKPEESARLVYDMFKSGQLAEALKNAPNAGEGDGPDLAKVVESIDTSKMPEFSVFAKYLTPGGGHAQMDEEGVSFVQFTLKKVDP